LSVPCLDCAPEPGETLTFVFDGVVEACNAAREQFGYERTQAISTHLTDQIAKAAELIGQDDYIAVLTLARTKEAARSPA
jgi:hypothetical protein